MLAKGIDNHAATARMPARAPLRKNWASRHQLAVPALPVLVLSLLLALLVALAIRPLPSKTRSRPFPWLMAARQRLSVYPLFSKEASLRLYARRRRRVSGSQTPDVDFIWCRSPTSARRTW